MGCFPTLLYFAGDSFLRNNPKQYNISWRPQDPYLRRKRQNPKLQASSPGAGAPARAVTGMAGVTERCLELNVWCRSPL